MKSVMDEFNIVASAGYDSDCVSVRISIHVGLKNVDCFLGFYLANEIRKKYDSKKDSTVCHH